MTHFRQTCCPETWSLVLEMRKELFSCNFCFLCSISIVRVLKINKVSWAGLQSQYNSASFYIALVKQSSDMYV
jgi:hypothetical protein